MYLYLRNHLSIRARLVIIIGLTCSSLLLVFCLPAIPQPLAYHNIADQRTILGLPNGLNVLSNLAFFIPGLLGIFILCSQPLPRSFGKPHEKIAFFVLFLGAILASIGSAYYHLDPNNETLVWDRLPIAVVQGAILCILIADRVKAEAGLYLLLPLILLGIIATLYWDYTEHLGRGDLRFYAYTEILPIIIILLLLWLFPARYQGQSYVFEAFAFYALGRIGEFFDSWIYKLTAQVISGHTLKHVAMGLGIYFLVRYMQYREISLKGP